MTLRWDVFNLFDRANFGNPNADITATNVGTISTLAGDPRVMQFRYGSGSDRAVVRNPWLVFAKPGNGHGLRIRKQN